MDNNVFPNPQTLPDVIADIVNETGAGGMSPGETAWTVPWALTVDENNAVSIKNDSVTRGQDQGGTSNLKVIKDFDGLFIDATALSRKDIEHTFTPLGSTGFVVGGTPETTQVGGILYPYINESEGLDPNAVEEFNTQQREVRKRFSEYYKNTYNQEYRFADQEYTSYKALGMIAHREPATAPASIPKRRFGRRK